MSRALYLKQPVWIFTSLFLLKRQKTPRSQFHSLEVILHQVFVLFSSNFLQKIVYCTGWSIIARFSKKFQKICPFITNYQHLNKIPLVACNVSHPMTSQGHKTAFLVAMLFFIFAPIFSGMSTVSKNINLYIKLKQTVPKLICLSLFINASGTFLLCCARFKHKKSGSRPQFIILF